jgi:hypothetical protein
MIVTCLLCGREESHEARGLGAACYQRARRAGMLPAFAPRPRGRPRTRMGTRTEYYRLYKRAWYARKKVSS